MWLLDALYKYRDSKRAAVIHNDETTSFADLWKRSEAVAGFLKSQHLADVSKLVEYHAPWDLHNTRLKVRQHAIGNWRRCEYVGKTVR